MPVETSTVGYELQEGPRAEDEVREAEGPEEARRGRRGRGLQPFAGAYLASALPYSESGFISLVITVPPHSSHVTYEADSIPRARKGVEKASRHPANNVPSSGCGHWSRTEPVTKVGPMGFSPGMCAGTIRKTSLPFSCDF